MFDTNSNRKSGKIGGVAFSATYDAQDRLLTYGTKSYEYNLNGELAIRRDSATGVTNTFEFDALGNLKSVTTPINTVRYQFDGLGRRSVRLLGSTVNHRYIYRNATQIAAVLNDAGAITQRFVYGTKQTPDYMIIGSTTYRFITDQSGSVREVVNTADGTISERIDYNELGLVTSDTNAGFQPFGFAGGLYDQDTKLVHFGARDYDPSVGRWISKDPILFGGRQTNLYGYTFNDPINFVDPSGKLVGFDDALAVVAVSGLAVGITSAVVNYQTTHSVTSALNAGGNGFVLGAEAGGAAIVAAALGAGTAVAAGAALAFDIGPSFLTAPTAIPGGSEGDFMNGLKTIQNPQSSCPQGSN